MIAQLKPYDQYQPTGQNWLPEVPGSWVLGPGSLAFSKRKAKRLEASSAQVLSLSYGQIVVKPEEAQHGLVPDSYDTYQVVSVGDIIVRGTDLQNDKTSKRIGLAFDDGIITSAYLCLRPTHRISAEYGYLLLKVFDERKELYRYGSGLRQNLDHGDLKRLPVFIPSAEEQDAIVRFLKYANERIDRFVRSKRKLIALLEEQKQAIINQAVTRGLDLDVPLKPSGISWLGDIPTHWEVRRAKQLCNSIVDCKNRTPPQVDDGSFTVVRTTNIRDGEFRPEGSFRTDSQSYDKWTERGAPRPGDVFFTREAPVGEACEVPEVPGLCMGQRMMYFRPSTELNPRFLVFSIYGPVVRTYIEHAVNGSTVGHLRLGQVGAIPLLWCPAPEQERIIQYLDSELKPVDETIVRTRAEIHLIEEYRTRLISEVVTGQLDVRGAEVPVTHDEDTTLDELLGERTSEFEEKLEFTEAEV